MFPSSIFVLTTEMIKTTKTTPDWAKEIFLAHEGVWRWPRGRWGFGVPSMPCIWQSFARGWLTQRHCAPVTDALQQQMKLSAGRWLYSDSRSALAPQNLANKYVGFQSCQGRRWTVGQGAKRTAKAFPSPPNLFSMSPVTSLGRSFSMSRPQGPRGPPDLTHCLPLFSLSLSLHLETKKKKNILHKEQPRVQRQLMVESDPSTWNDFPSLGVKRRISYGWSCSVWWSQCRSQGAGGCWRNAGLDRRASVLFLWTCADHLDLLRVKKAADERLWPAGYRF